METKGQRLLVNARSRLVMIRGIPKEGWKLVYESALPSAAVVMIRGIPKEGWKLIMAPIMAPVPHRRVMIRGIPKEGWKHDTFLRPGLITATPVMIRGIPKEGWKLGLVIWLVGTIMYRDDQRNP